ncbi:Pyridoxal 5'-phosphate synthase subunit snz1 [Coemansia sp. IMI 203386]|nr:Pyridoxal 5'-phosphate synthase subunit snz1 [Coemansia sp. IMI 203386]
MSNPLLDIDVKLEFARRLKGGVIIEVQEDIHAKIAQRSGARAVMPVAFSDEKETSETIPDQELIAIICDAVALPVFAKIQVGHTMQAKIAEHFGVSFIDESDNVDDGEAGGAECMDKTKFETPFCSGVKNLGDIVNALVKGAALVRLYTDELGCPKDPLVNLVKLEKIPVPIFASGFIGTPANAAELMSKGFDGVIIDRNQKLKAAIINKLKKGVIFEVGNEEHALIAQRAGARAVMPIADSGDSVKRMPDPKTVKAIFDAVAIPTIGRVRVGHIIEAQIMEKAGADIIDESEMYGKGDKRVKLCIDKSKLYGPCFFTAFNLGEVAKAIRTGASAIRITAEDPNGSNGNAVQIVQIRNQIIKQLKRLQDLVEKKSKLNPADPANKKKIKEVDYDIGEIVGDYKKEKDFMIKLAVAGKITLPVFASNFVATPADVALIMQHGFDGVFVTEEVFENHMSSLRYANALVHAVAKYDDPVALAQISEDLGRNAYGGGGRRKRRKRRAGGGDKSDKAETKPIQASGPITILD